MATSWGLAGYGTIGKELARQLAQDRLAKRLGLETKPRFIIRKTGIMESDGETPSKIQNYKKLQSLPDVLFVALPSSEGELAYELISHFLKHGKMAVTAEKGATSNHFEQLSKLSDNFARLGINATVGGGTRLMAIAREYAEDIANISQLHLSLNGTLTAIMSSIAPPGGAGKSLGYASYEAAELGYAEPGAESPYEVIRGEAEGDIPKKTAIFFNAVGFSEKPVNWQKFEFRLSDREIARVVEEANVRRFIVSFYPKKNPASHIVGPEKNIIGGFSKTQGDWLIVGGFRNIERNPLFSRLGALTGPGNGLVIGLGPDETDGVYALTGPGAGPRPTVNTMMDDFLRLSRN